jgi:hypothetical protein
LNNFFKRALASAGIPSVLEPPGLERKNGKRPDGLTSVNYKFGKSLVWDVTCVDTMAISYIADSINAAGSAAAAAEQRKIHHYRELVEGRFIFGPLAFETFGPWGPECKLLIGEIGRKITERTGEKRSSEFLRQRISIEIQRGNAACVFGTHKASRGLDEIYYVLRANI